jgi:hypothetical protein
VKSKRKHLKQLAALMEQGVEHQQAGRLAEAAQVYASVLKRDPQQHVAIYLSAIVAYQARTYERAIPLMESACIRLPGFAAAHHNLGRMYQDTGRSEEAEAKFRDAVRLDPRLVEAHVELGNLALHRGEVDAAFAHFDHADGLEANSVEATYNRSFARLLRGDFERGFRDYEERWNLPLWSAEHARVDLTGPVWDGSPLAGRRLLVSAEQGYGDTLMMCRFWHHPLLREADVTWEVQDRLERLLAANAPAGHRVVTRGAPLEYDVRLPMMSLPHRMQVRTDADLDYGAYLAPAPGVEQRLPDFPGVRLRVGLRGAGNPHHRNDHRRSTKLEHWEPLLALEGIQWVGLEAKEGQDWADTAAVMAQCDVVISVDTAAAHLAGAMGRPTWILIPKAPEVRWQLHREDSPWYPTARLWRQREAGNWPEVLERVKAELERMALPRAA